MTTQQVAGEKRNPGLPTEPEPSLSIGPLEDSIEVDEENTEAPPTNMEAEPVAEMPAPQDAAPAVPVKPVATPATAKPVEPGESRAELQAALDRLVQLEAQQARVQQQETARQENDALEAYAADLTERGFQPEDVQRFVAEGRANLRDRRQLEAQAKQMQQTYADRIQGHQAKVMIAQYFAKTSGMPFDDLMRLHDPEVMEAKADAFSKGKELEKLKRDQVKVQKFASTGPSAARPSSYGALLDSLLAGRSLDSMTRAEKHVLYPDRY